MEKQLHRSRIRPGSREKNNGYVCRRVGGDPDSHGDSHCRLHLSHRLGGEQLPGEALPEELGHRPVYPHADLPSPDHRVGSCIRFHHHKPAADVKPPRPGEIRGGFLKIIGC